MIKYILLLMPMLMMKCEEDPIKEGIQTHVSGRIFDNENQIPVTGHMVFIQEYEGHFAFDGGGTDVFRGYIDSVATDANGYYQLDFTTTGNGTAYRVAAASTNDTYGYLEPIEIMNPGQDTEVDFWLTHLYPVNLKVTLNNVSSLPVNIYPELRPYTTAPLEENGTELTRLIYVNKNHSSTVFFTHQLPDYTNKGFHITIPQTGTTEPVDFPITISDSDFTE